MAGVTDRDFRLIVRRIGGVGLVAMEFISSQGDRLAATRRRASLMHFATRSARSRSRSTAPTPRTMAEAARVVEELGADVCDINMGCPANKVLKGCAGAALMGDLELAEEIIVAVQARDLASRSPSSSASASTTAGSNYLELGRICEAERRRRGGDARAHRAPDVRRRGRLVAHRAAQGDALDPGDRQRRRARRRRTRCACSRETGCDGVMIGRGATKNPWIFRQTAALLSGGAVTEPTLADRRDLILQHFRLVAEREPSGFALHKLRKFTGWYTHGLPNGRKLRQRINELPDAESFLAGGRGLLRRADAGAGGVIAP